MLYGFKGVSKISSHYAGSQTGLQCLRHEVLLRGKNTPSVIACGDATFPKGTASVVAGKLLIAPNTLALRATACALSVFASQIHTPPFVTCGDIFPRSGGSLSSKGEARALPETFLLNLNLQQRALDLGSPFGGAGAGAPERAINRRSQKKRLKDLHAEQA